MPTQAQPYRKGPRQPSAALAAMLAGRPVGMMNPMDVQRGFTKGRSLADLLRESSAQRPSIRR